MIENHVTRAIAKGTSLHELFICFIQLVKTLANAKRQYYARMHFPGFSLSYNKYFPIGGVGGDQAPSALLIIQHS
jgi:hypothetical protein